MRCTDWVVYWESLIYDLSWCFMIRLELYVFRRRQMWNAFFNILCWGYNYSQLWFVLAWSLEWRPVITFVHNKVTWKLSHAINLYKNEDLLQHRCTHLSHLQDPPWVLAEPTFVISQRVISLLSLSWFLLYHFRVDLKDRRKVGIGSSKEYYSEGVSNGEWVRWICVYTSCQWRRHDIGMRLLIKEFKSWVSHMLQTGF